MTTPEDTGKFPLDEKPNLSRRDFIKYSAAASAATAAWYSTSMKTDAVANQIGPMVLPPGGEVVHSYMYNGEDP